MEKRKVVVKTPGKIVVYKNRKIRSPFSIELLPDEIRLFEFSLRAAGVERYSVVKVNEKDDVEEPITIPEKEEVIIEDLEIEDEDYESLSTLGKLLKDDRNGES